MSNLRQIIVWFLVCLVLGLYAKSAGFIPTEIGRSNTGAILGTKTSPGFGPLLNGR